MSQPFECKPGDIVQADPQTSTWGPCLVVVEHNQPWGIPGFTSIPRSGRVYTRLKWEEIRPTGGVVVFDELV